MSESTLFWLGLAVVVGIFVLAITGIFQKRNVILGYKNEQGRTFGLEIKSSDDEKNNP